MSLAGKAKLGKRQETLPGHLKHTNPETLSIAPVALQAEGTWGPALHPA